MRNFESIDSNQVIIRVWPPSISSAGKAGPGHISLQTFKGGLNGRGHYISFWPGPCPARGCNNSNDHFHTREEDVEYCGQAYVDNTHTLYGLNVYAINKEYEIRKSSSLRWTLKPSFFSSNDPKIANCTTLVKDLLIIGGINNLVQEKTFLNKIIYGLKSFAPTSSFNRRIITGITLASLIPTYIYASNLIERALINIRNNYPTGRKGASMIFKTLLSFSPDTVNNSSKYEITLLMAEQMRINIKNDISNLLLRVQANTPTGLKLCVLLCCVTGSCILYTTLGTATKFKLETPADVANLAQLARMNSATNSGSQLLRRF